MQNLAEEILNQFPVFLKDYVGFRADDHNEVVDYVEEQVAKITPLGYIIKEGCLSHLLDNLNVHLIYEIEKRIKDMKNSFNKEENALKENYEFEIFIEKDGY